MKYTFDELKDLYIKDPEEFKRVAADVINEVIESAPEHKQERLKIKQWQLDQELNKIKNPIARMNKMVGIFWEGVNEFIKVSRQHIPEGTSTTVADATDVQVDEPKKAENNVVPFKIPTNKNDK